MPLARTGPVFDIREIPFSFTGSWFNVSPVIAEKVYADDLHLVSHQTGLHPVLRLRPMLDGDAVATTVVVRPSHLTWQHDIGRIEAAYERADTLRIRGTGLGLALLAAQPELTPFSGPYLFRDPVDGAHIITLYETGRRYRITILSGAPRQVLGEESLRTAARGVIMDESAPWEIAVEEFDAARPPYTASMDFPSAVAAARDQFDTFLEAVAGWRSPQTPAADLAAYVLWSATVSPAGMLGRTAVLMSKHWMDKVWSWDHCFNAIALAAGAPRLAWDQFLLPFDHQDSAGGLPDSVAHSEVLYNFVKPPIHGWALRRIRSHTARDLGRDALLALYQQLRHWTNFWLTTRRAPGHDLPHYHHGNDSGWDNATTFDPAHVIESVDLAAFLILQLHELASLATELGDPTAAHDWTATARQLTRAVLAAWNGDAFHTTAAHTGQTWTSGSLLNLMPIVLADLLPAEIRTVMVERIGRHLTEYGLATELPDSPDYEADGYWRGPIWAPSTVLIEDGLRRAGHVDLADEISRRFRGLCENSGFAENFDAKTGAGLRDRAYTWTASSYLILAAAYEHRRHTNIASPTGLPHQAIEPTGSHQRV
ncbi:trehalase family glycosidase [Rugosimonospora acidiphila]|uniref:Trehalase family glycosidase n=1 Tax=Rugosimonospora acidiphila TaxID=556531 RepID=A0ABP9RLP1_9ACTN